MNSPLAWLNDELIKGLDRFIDREDTPPNPRLSREEAALVIIRDWLQGQGFVSLPEGDSVQPISTASAYRDMEKPGPAAAPVQVRPAVPKQCATVRAVPGRPKTKRSTSHSPPATLLQQIGSTSLQAARMLVDQASIFRDTFR
jgi:hypothetical protein